MITYTEEQLCSFGNFLFKTYGVQVHSNDGKNQPIGQREVSHADIENWIAKDDPELFLPSQFQIDQPVFLDLWGSKVHGEIKAVHFYRGKVKYDLEVFGTNGDTSRIYNVDSVFVIDKIPGKQEQPRS